MKKTLIITIIALFIVIGGVTAKVCLDGLNKDTNSEAVETVTPAPTEVAEETSAPEVEQTEAAETLAPTEEVATEAPTEVPEATSTPETETAAPEVDYSNLSDRELTDKIVTAITARHATVKAMTSKERVVYALYAFNKDAKGSLYEYLTGSNNATAAYVAEGFAAVNATMTKELFEDFIDSSRIELSDTSALSKLQKEDYHFEIFDAEYAGIAKSEDLTSLIASYIKANLDTLK